MKITSKQLQEMILAAVKNAMIAEQGHWGREDPDAAALDRMDPIQLNDAMEEDIINLFPHYPNGRKAPSGQFLLAPVPVTVLKAKLAKLQQKYAGQGGTDIKQIWNNFVDAGQIKTFKSKKDGKTYSKFVFQLGQGG